LNAVLAPTAAIHSRTALAMNSGPLSERTWPGTPRRMNRSDRASMTSVELSLRSMRIARHSRVNSSMMLSMRNFLPLWSDPRRSHRTRHGWGAPVEAGYTIRHSARDVLSSVASGEPSAPPVARCFDALGIHRPALGAQHRGDP